MTWPKARGLVSSDPDTLGDAFFYLEESCLASLALTSGENSRVMMRDTDTHTKILDANFCPSLHTPVASLNTLCLVFYRFWRNTFSFFKATVVSYFLGCHYGLWISRIRRCKRHTKIKLGELRCIWGYLNSSVLPSPLMCACVPFSSGVN